MSIVAYREAMTLSYDDPSFQALIMAAMRKADDTNLQKLQEAFPEDWKELKARYSAPGGCLDQREMDWLTRLLEGEQEPQEQETEEMTE
jgi:hypothetical protein